MRIVPSYFSLFIFLLLSLPGNYLFRSFMESKLQSGITLIVDCYSYSGVAFSSAKGLDLNGVRLQPPDMGLLAPDLVLYLDISPEKASGRGGYGGERYEQLQFQRKVAQTYQVLGDASWKIIDAGLPVEDVERETAEGNCIGLCQDLPKREIYLPALVELTIYYCSRKKSEMYY